MPEIKNDTKLFELVNRYQIHKCTSSCLRSFFNNKKLIQKCRYGF